jgi:glycosyltransferase involved in cell wall biosynthesis
MKILVIQESDWVEKGPHQSHHLMERMSKKGHEVRVIDYEILWRLHEDKSLVSTRKVFKNECKAVEGGDITVIRPSIVKFPALDYVSLLYTHRKEIKKQLDEFNPDVIIGFGILNAMQAIRLAEKTPFVYYLIDSLHRLVPKKAFQPLAKYIESKNLKRADRVVTINEKLKEYAIKMGANPEETQVVRAGIDAERYDPNIDGNEIRRDYGIKQDDSILYFMGTLFDFSGLKEVALELAKIKDEKPKIKLLFVGKGDAFDDLQKIKKEHDLNSQMILTGRQPFERIPEFVAAADICMLPAYNNEIMRDIVPIKMYEYMAMGKPVITTKLPGVMKEFGEDHGVIYVDRPEAILNKAIELIEPGSVKEEGGKARRFVEKYNWDDIVDKFERVLEEVIKVRGGK